MKHLKATPFLITSALVMSSPMFWAPLSVATTAPAPPADAGSASAGERDPNPQSEDPATVTAEPLPTVQINGVAWDQVVIGNTVYVAGEFTKARPAGVQPGGKGERRRSNLLAYHLKTGELLNSWRPHVDARVLAITTSPDRSRIYIGGSFTSVYPKPNSPSEGAVTVRRLAALDPADGSVIETFMPNPDATVAAIDATTDTVYFGGSFGQIGPNAARSERTKMAAVRASNGSALPWAPLVTDGTVTSLAVSPEADTVVVGGSFTKVNGSSSPGYGLAAVDAVTAAIRPWAANDYVRAAGRDPARGESAAISSLTSSGDSVYGTAYTYASTGNFEGMVKMSWDGGDIELMADCSGDSHDAVRHRGVVYTASHMHNCSNVPNGFQESKPREFSRANAFSDVAVGTLGENQWSRGQLGNFAGLPAARLLHWFPEVDAGTYTGQTQGTWTVEAAKRYVVAGGEFPAINGRAQEGLARFKLPKAEVSGDARLLSRKASRPRLISPAPGTMVVSWPMQLDYDSERLTYKVVRRTGGSTSVVHTQSADSVLRHGFTMSFVDRDVRPGASVQYKVKVVDNTGEKTTSRYQRGTVATSGFLTKYQRTVLADGPSHLWRLGEGSPTRVADDSGFGRTLESTTGSGQANGIGRGGALEFGGDLGQALVAPSAEAGPNWYTVEAWINTSTSQAGYIVGMGNSSTATSSRNDHLLYLNDDGKVHFGSEVYGRNYQLSSPGALNDGTWHHVVGTVDQRGMTLYVDGVDVARRADTRAGRASQWFWRIGGDRLARWTDAPGSGAFFGRIDEVAVYGRALSAAEVKAHFEVLASRVDEARAERSGGPAAQTEAETPAAEPSVE